MSALTQIRTLIVLMMENRSFDHMLGYLSLPPFNRTEVDGLRTDPGWLARFTNPDHGESIQPFLSTNPYTLPDDFDPPHERSNVAQQMGPDQGDVFPMTGFVGAIPDSVTNNPATRRLVMEYFGADQAPTNHFFASNFAICDRWFSSLPAGTQPNRLMSLSGFSQIEINQTPLPGQDVVYDWLTAHGVSWRVYHEGIPFVSLMPKWIPEVLLSHHFRAFRDLEQDLVNTPPDDQPQVIFVEPTYGDGPHLGPSDDDHAPSGISHGQEFLMQVYNAITASPAFWRGAALIITYDEHGGFFDHVSPPMVPTDPPHGAVYPRFNSLGVRIPAYVISPFVAARTVSHAILDHTSVLKLLGEKFGNGSYSAVVDARAVRSVSDVFNLDKPRQDVPVAPALDKYLASRPALPTNVPAAPPKTPLQQAFREALVHMKQHGAGPDHPKFGALLKQIEANAQ